MKLGHFVHRKMDFFALPPPQTQNPNTPPATPKIGAASTTPITLCLTTAFNPPPQAILPLFKKLGFAERRGFCVGMVLGVMAQVAFVGVVAGKLAYAPPKGFKFVPHQSRTQSSTKRLGICGDSAEGGTGLPCKWRLHTRSMSKTISQSRLTKAMVT